MRDHIKRNLLGESFWRLIVCRVVDRLSLIPKLVRARFTSAGNRLISANNNALDARAVVLRLQGYNHLRGRAVGIRNDILLCIVENRLWIHLGND